MSKEEIQHARDEIMRGIELYEYRLIRDKAMHNQTLVYSDGHGGTVERSAREVYVERYHEPVPTF